MIFIFVLSSTPFTLTEWSCSGSWREWRHVLQTQDDRTFQRIERAMEKRLPFWHLCNLFLMHSEWQPTYIHCKLTFCFDMTYLQLQIIAIVLCGSLSVVLRCAISFFSCRQRVGDKWRRPRVVHAMIAICVHCNFCGSCWADTEPRVDLLAPPVLLYVYFTQFFLLFKFWMAEEGTSCTCDDNNLHLLQIRLQLPCRQMEPRHGSYMLGQWPAYRCARWNIVMPF